MEKILGQDEIDALFASARASAATEEEAIAEPVRPEIELYNFGRTGNISNDQMRAIATVNDLFARNLMHTVGAWLRTEYRVALVSGEQMGYGEFVERLTDQTYLCSVRLEPLGASGVLEIELTLALPMVDILLGGRGRAEPARALTDIEELIMASVVQMILRELNVAWGPVGLQFSFDRRETPGQVTRMLPPGEKTLCVCFEVRTPEATGVINLCLPAVVLNTMLRQLIASRDRPRRRSEEVRGRVRQLVGDAVVGSVLQFPPMRLSAGRIAELTEGSLLELPLPCHTPSELKVGGLSLSSAWPVRVGEHRGARIESAQPPAGIRAAAALLSGRTDGQQTRSAEHA